MADKLKTFRVLHSERHAVTYTVKAASMEEVYEKFDEWLQDFSDGGDPDIPDRITYEDKDDLVGTDVVEVTEVE